MVSKRLIPILGERSPHRYLLFFFAFAFSARLSERLGYWFGMATKQMTFDDYMITEWLINYQGGYLRRGLIGSVILWLWEQFRLPPVTVIFCLSLAAFAALSIYLWNLSRGLVPRWVLFTTPLLGYPVFINGIMLRKDIFIALVIAAVFNLLIHRRFRGSDWVAALIFSLLILSHEVSFFLAFPALCCIVFLREYADILARNQGPEVFRPKSLISPRFISLLIPLFTFLSVALRAPARPEAIAAIASAWKSAYKPSLPFPGPAGAIAWLSKPLEEGIACSKGTFAMTVHGIPYWLIIVLAIVSGIVLLGSVLSIASLVRAWFFVISSTLGYVFMFPVFYATCDHGRWVILTLMIGFILSLEIPLQWQESVMPIIRFPSQLQTFVFPSWLAPLGLLFWGLSVVIWCPTGAPIALILQIYFYLRVFGLIPKISL